METRTILKVVALAGAAVLATNERARSAAKRALGRLIRPHADRMSDWGPTGNSDWFHIAGNEHLLTSDEREKREQEEKERGEQDE
jgi:hypothetical protein